MNLQTMTSALMLCCCSFAAVSAPAAADEQDGPQWVEIALPTGAGAMAPKLSAANHGEAWLTWLEPHVNESVGPAPQPAAMQLRCAQWSVDGKFGQPLTIAQRDDFFANWADVPSIMQARDDGLIAHWLQRSGPGAYAYDVILARSIDGGRSWKVLGPAHNDGTQTEHGFVSMVREGDAVRAFWLDGREMQAPAADDAAAGAGAHGHGQGDMTLRSTLITGHTLGQNDLLDVRVCECCNTSAAEIPDGCIIAYRDRSEQDVRDIAVVRRIGEKWSDPAIVHADGWQISGCPVNGPAIAARGSSVAVAWFTAANHSPRVVIAFSSDAGATFSKPLLIDDNEPLGRVALTMLDDGSAVVCWLADQGARTAALKIVRCAAGGELAQPLTLAELPASRASGFPTIAAATQGVLVVWTDGGKPTRVRCMLVKTGSLK